MAKFLVTGGTGFIGSHLCERLLRIGHAVRVIDDLSTGKRENLPAGAEVSEGDAADRGFVGAAAAGVDGIFHLAANPRLAGLELNISAETTLDQGLAALLLRPRGSVGAPHQS